MKGISGKILYSVILVVFVSMVFHLLVGNVWADTLVLKNKDVIVGKFDSGTKDHIMFRIGSAVKYYPISQIQLITFGEGTEVTATESDPFSDPSKMAPPHPVEGLTLRAGSKIRVEIQTEVNTRYHQPGHKFLTLVDSDIYVRGQLAIPKGSRAQGTIVEIKRGVVLTGERVYKLALNKIVIDEQVYHIKTGRYADIYKKSNSFSFDDEGDPVTGEADAPDERIMHTLGQKLLVPPGSVIEFVLEKDLEL